MRRIFIGLGIVAVVVIAFFGSAMVASEVGGEVVTVFTVSDAGEPVETRLWIVDDGGFAWLRAGQAQSRWLARIDATPEIEVERAGQRSAYRAVPVRDAAARDRIHRRMAEKYGWADRLIAVMRDPSGSVAIRLEPTGDAPNP
ncbi:MAG: hypothetical protein JSU66_15870 [Deltaproteobacteria bacterium]|nr:MAG: hypothetical protein JSU66_15870 [Deltaproteobacteria bacterium]